MLRTLPFRARLSLLAILVIPLYGQDGCNPCLVDYMLCDLNAVNDGWCLGGTCVANACTGVDCDDTNDCTTDVCNPMNGSCAHTAREEFFPPCDAGGGSQGVCFDTICILGGTDDCLEPGVGRINCCGDCGGPEATCPPSEYLASGTSCDPTGVQEPGLPNQEGTCNANGVCVYDSGDCAGVVCQDDTTECVKEWCDPNTYLPGQVCESAQVEGSPSCGGSGACVAGICRSQNDCVSIGSGFRNCVLGCPMGEMVTGIPDLFCDPTGALNPSLTADPTLGGICSIDSDCVWQACAIPDPVNPGFFVEKSCDDLTECTEDECDPATGVCMHTALPDFTPCNGGQGICFSGWSSIGLVVPSWCVPMPGP